MSEFSILDVSEPGASPVRPPTGLGVVASAFVVLSALADLALGWSQWHGYGLVRDFLGGNAVAADLSAGDALNRTFTYLDLSAQVLAGVFFLTWLWKARVNSESLSLAEHRHTRGWTIGGWFCPIVNLWFPQHVVTDIWRTSRPEAAGQSRRDGVRGA